MGSKELSTDTREIPDEARDLLDTLPPLSPDHKSARLAGVKLRHAEATLGQKDLSDKTLLKSGQFSPTGGSHGEQRSEDGEGVTVFLDMDTVLLSKHRGRYGPELGLQADLPAAIDRLSEVADRIVVLVNPPSADSGHNLDTEHRLSVLSGGLVGQLDRLIIATCPHDDGDRCDCAKPGQGLIQQHLKSERDAHDGWYIGGDQEGMVAGRGAGLHTIRIGPHGDDHLSAVHRSDYEARDLLDAANHIILESLVAA